MPSSTVATHVTRRCPLGLALHYLILLGLIGLLAAACTASPSTPAPAAQLPASPAPGEALLPPPGTAREAYWPTSGWRTSTPEEQGMDSSRLIAMLDSIRAQSLNLHSLLVIRDGYIVSETYFGSYDQDSRFQLYSCTKSFIATLVGIVFDRGDLQRLDQPVLDFFPGRTFANLDARKEAMTLEDLLTMRSGLDWQDDDPTIGAMARSPDWVQFVLDKPMIQAPGEQFNYCTGCSHVLSAILQQATGLSARDYAAPNLFEPLGITNLRWDTDNSGMPIGGWGLQLTPRDMAKLGYLYLHKGSWDGRQIVSSDWVATATQKHTATDGSLGYGYQWWTYPSYGAYTALGLYGQTIFVVPQSDLIVVTTADVDNHEPIFHLIEEYILPSIHGE
jgi:CubicO group peptidase (beta-lactamase class C family)